jgi:hypothetical protein
MDIGALASSVTTALVPLLPYLLKRVLLVTSRQHFTVPGLAAKNSTR